MTLQGQALENRCSFLEFLQRVDLAETWIQEKVGAPLDRAFGGLGTGAKGLAGEEKSPWWFSGSMMGGALVGRQKQPCARPHPSYRSSDQG